MKNLISIILFLFIAFVDCQNSISKKKDIATNKKTTGSVMVDGTKLTFLIQGKGIPCLVLETDPAYYSEKLREGKYDTLQNLTIAYFERGGTLLS